MCNDSTILNWALAALRSRFALSRLLNLHLCPVQGSCSICRKVIQCKCMCVHVHVWVFPTLILHSFLRLLNFLVNSCSVKCYIKYKRHICMQNPVWCIFSCKNLIKSKVQGHVENDIDACFLPDLTGNVWSQQLKALSQSLNAWSYLLTRVETDPCCCTAVEEVLWSFTKMKVKPHCETSKSPLFKAWLT